MCAAPALNIAIRPLTALAPEIIRRLGAGYVSPGMYAVRKAEAGERIAITLEPVALDAPYARRWVYSDEEVAHYQAIVREEGLSFAACDGQEIVGIAIASAERWNRTLWVWELHVAAGYRRRGIGRRLVEALDAAGRAAGLRTMLVETQNTNLPAIRFYRRAGFTLEGIDLSYYDDEDSRGEVALFLKRPLEPPGRE